MKKLLGGWAVFMFLLVIMAANSSAALYELPVSSFSMANISLFSHLQMPTVNILETLKGPIIALMAIFGVVIALKIVTAMMAPSDAEVAYAEYEDEYNEYSEKMERKAAFKERYENEHWNDSFIEEGDSIIGGNGGDYT